MAEVNERINNSSLKSQHCGQIPCSTALLSSPSLQPQLWKSQTQLVQVQEELIRLERQAALLKPLVAQYVIAQAQQAEGNFAVITSVAYGYAYAKLHREHGASADLFLSLDSAWDHLDLAEQQKLFQAAEEITRLQRVNLQLGIPTASIDLYSLAATKTGEEAKDLIRVLQAVSNYGIDSLTPARSNLVSILHSLEKRHKALNEQLLAWGKPVRCCKDLEDALFYVKKLDQELVSSGQQICRQLNGGSKPAAICFTENADSLVFMEEARERDLADRQFVCLGDSLRRELAGIYEKVELLQGSLFLSLNDIPISEELKAALGISSGLSSPMANYPKVEEAILLGVFDKDLSEQIDRIALLEPVKRKAVIEAFVRSISWDSFGQVYSTEAIGKHVAHPVYRVLGGWKTVGSLVGNKNELAQSYFKEVVLTAKQAKAAADSGNYRQALALLHRIHGRLEEQQTDNWSYNRFHQQLFLDTFMIGVQMGMLLAGSASALRSELIELTVESEARQALNPLGIRSMPRNFWVTNSSAPKTGLRIYNPEAGEAEAVATATVAGTVEERATIPFSREPLDVLRKATERFPVLYDTGGPALKLELTPTPFRVIDSNALDDTLTIGSSGIRSLESVSSLPQPAYADLVLPAIVATQPWTLVIEREGGVPPVVGDRLIPIEEDFTLPILPNALPGTFEWERQRQLQEENERQNREAAKKDPYMVRASVGGDNPLNSEKSSEAKQPAEEENEPQMEAIRGFLEEKERSLTDLKFQPNGISFHTQDGEYFVPTESVDFVSKHPELLLKNGIQWQNTGIYKDGIELKFLRTGSERIIDSSVKLTKAELADGVWVFRKDYRSIGDRWWQWDEAQNFSRIGGQSIVVNPTVSFRVPAHYVATPHGIIMEFINAPTVHSALSKMDQATADQVRRHYEQLKDFIWKKREEYGERLFFIPREPLNRDQMGMTMVFLESYSEEQGSRFILTDLKGR